MIWVLNPEHKITVSIELSFYGGQADKLKTGQGVVRGVEPCMGKDMV